MKKLKITLYTLLSISVLYIVSGFFLIPFIAKKEIIKNLDELLVTKTKIEKIYFNPLTLNLEIDNFALLEDQEEIVKFSKLYIDFGALKSIEKRYFHIKNILLDGIYLNIKESEEGSFNLANLVKNSKEEELIKKDEEEAESLVDFLVAKIILKDANIDFTSFLEKRKYNLQLKDINYTIYDFGTFKNSLSSNNLVLKLNENTDIKIGGGVTLNPFLAYGRVDITNLKIKEILDFDNSFFNFDINKEANLNLSLNYNIETKPEFNIILNSELFEIKDLKLNQNQKEIATLSKLDLKTFDFNLKNQSINLKGINIDKLNAKMILDKQGLNFANFVNIETSTKNNIEDEQNSQNEKPWFINLQDTKLLGSFNFNDNLNNSKLNIKDIKANVSDINIVNSDVTIKNANIVTSTTNYEDKKNKLDISSNKTDVSSNNIEIKDSKINIFDVKLKKDKIAFSLDSSKLKIETDKLDLNLQKLLIFDGISFAKSNLNLENLHLEDKNNNFSLNSKITKLKIDDFLLDKTDNISIKNSELYDTKLDFFEKNSSFSLNSENTNLKLSNLKLKNSDISINKIVLKEPKLDIVNLDSKLKIDTKNIDLQIDNLLSKPDLLKIEKTALKNPHISIVLPKNSQKDEKIENKIKQNEQLNSNKLSLNIGPVDIKNMTLDFEDKNLPIPFKTTISKLKGEISNIKNQDKGISKLEIRGVVDEYGVAKITGTINPNSIKILTDINMKFNNIAMKSFTPYTAKFVGRTIKDGKLELDLNYNISNSNLKAKNNIIIKKLELGERVESLDAISLPLDLAITLLEDSSNTIDINLPISGNIDDPQFSVASIVWKAFVNLITKAITSPFSLIGSLFNFSEDEIKSVNFEPNKNKISPIQRETLDKIATILENKKEFAISFSPSFDEKSEKENIALKRAENIKLYLVEKKKIDEKQVIVEKNIRKSSTNIDLNLKQIESKN